MPVAMPIDETQARCRPGVAGEQHALVVVEREVVIADLRPLHRHLGQRRDLEVDDAVLAARRARARRPSSDRRRPSRSARPARPATRRGAGCPAFCSARQANFVQVASVTHFRSAQSTAPSPSSSMPLSQISRIDLLDPGQRQVDEPSLPAWNAWTRRCTGRAAAWAASSRSQTATPRDRRRPAGARCRRRAASAAARQREHVRAAVGAVVAEAHRLRSG